MRKLWMTYGKTISQGVVTSALAAYTAYLAAATDEHVTAVEWLSVAAGVVATVVVWLVPVVHEARYVKTAAAFLTWALATAGAVWVDGWDPATDIGIIVAAVAATVGAHRAPATSTVPAGVSA